MNNDIRQVNTYDPAQIQKKKKKSSGWKKGLLIFLIITVVIAGACVSCSLALGNAFGGSSDSDYLYYDDYIGVLDINGTMEEGGDGTGTYNQKWLMKRVEQMKTDPMNKGMILSINTPGGSVYAIDELYLKIQEYKEETGRPVYTYMRSMAASGGYYISAGTDKIYANRNCWTGSIGVTIGTIYDVSGFLEKMGVKTVTITAGENKAMGSSVEPLTREQKAIFQGLVDEAYDQFTGVVADGRKMKLSEVKKLADGRVYTAKQAKENGLIDEIGTFKDAAADMQARYHLADCELQMMTYTPKSTFSSLFGKMAGDRKSGALTEYEQLKELMENNNTFTITYMSPVRK